MTARTLRRAMHEEFSDTLADSLRRLSKGQKVFYLDSGSGSDSYGGRRISSPFATLAAAYDACTTANCDIIFVLPNHAETTTAVLTASKTDVTIKGLKLGNKYPVFTGNGAVDFINLTGAGQEISGLRFAAPETDAQTSDVNVAAANCKISDTIHIGSQTSKNKVDIITLAVGANDVLIDGVKIYNTVVECVGGIVLEGAFSRGEIKNCFVFTDTVGFTDGCISDEDTATGLWIHHNN